MSITLLLVIATVAVSVPAFSNRELFSKLDLEPYMILHRREYHRFLSHAFLHADWGHLAVNMFVLYTFGRLVEVHFAADFGAKWMLYYSMLYLGGILFSALPGYGRHKNNPSYRAVGASGAVSAVVYAYILINPLAELRFILLPFFELPAIAFGAIYLAAEIYLDRRGGSHIAHSAHYFGGIFGLVFTFILEPDYLLRFFV